MRGHGSFQPYYNRAGEPITQEEALPLIGDPEARQVAVTTVGPYVVSTVHLVIDHGFGRGAPIIFETMVFSRDEWEDAAPGLRDIDTERYATEDEARQGHEDMVTLVRATVQEAIDGDDYRGADDPDDDAGAYRPVETVHLPGDGEGE